MSEWWTYRLTSFLLFSPRTYHRLFELYNEAVWPLQVLAAAIGFAIAGLLFAGSPHRHRIIAGLLAGCWVWVAWAFLYQRYAQINWAAPWFAAAFAAQAVLLVALRVAADPATPGAAPHRRIAALIAVTIVGYPLLAPFTGRPWSTAEVFGLAPDPTAIVTVGALAVIQSPSRWLLLAIPTLWCIAAALTQWAMAAPEALAIASLTVCALLPALRRS